MWGTGSRLFAKTTDFFLAAGSHADPSSTTLAYSLELCKAFLPLHSLELCRGCELSGASSGDGNVGRGGQEWSFSQNLMEQ